MVLSAAPVFSDESADEREQYQALYRATEICKEMLGDITKVNWDDRGLMERVEKCFEANGVMSDEEYRRSVSRSYDPELLPVTRMGGSSSASQLAPIALPDKETLTRRLQGQRATIDTGNISADAEEGETQTSPARGGVYVPVIKNNENIRGQKEDRSPRPLYFGR